MLFLLPKNARNSHTILCGRQSSKKHPPKPPTPPSHKKESMAERERSRSRSPARDESKGGGDNYAQEDGDSGVEEVKLYVGNLDYGK